MSFGDERVELEALGVLGPLVDPDAWILPGGAGTGLRAPRRGADGGVIGVRGGDMVCENAEVAEWLIE